MISITNMKLEHERKVRDFKIAILSVMEDINRNIYVLGTEDLDKEHLMLELRAMFNRLSKELGYRWS